MIKFSPISPTKIEELTAGSDESTQPSPVGIRTRVIWSDPNKSELLVFPLVLPFPFPFLLSLPLSCRHFGKEKSFSFVMKFTALSRQLPSLPRTQIKKKNSHPWLSLFPFQLTFLFFFVVFSTFDSRVVCPHLQVFMCSNISFCVCVCVCVCQRKTKDRADGVREKSAHCPRRDSNRYWMCSRVCVCVCVCVRKRKKIELTACAKKVPIPLECVRVCVR